MLPHPSPPTGAGDGREGSTWSVGPSLSRLPLCGDKDKRGAGHGGLAQWIGARIEWCIRPESEPEVVFDGRIDTAEDVGDGVTRISGALAGGGRFVLVTDESSLTNP